MLTSIHAKKEKNENKTSECKKIAKDQQNTISSAKQKFN